MVAKKVSSLWTLVPWLTGRWYQSLPQWITDNVERAVYDGLTRHEWFVAQVEELHASQRQGKER